MLCNTENCHEIENTILSTLQRTIKCLIPPRLIPAEHTFSRACISSLRKRSLVIWVWGDRVSLDFINRRDHSKNNKSNFIGSYPIKWDLKANFFLNTSHTHTITCALGVPTKYLLCAHKHLSELLSPYGTCLSPCPALLYQSSGWNWLGWRKPQGLVVQKVQGHSCAEGQHTTNLAEGELPKSFTQGLNQFLAAHAEILKPSSLPRSKTRGKSLCS